MKTRFFLSAVSFAVVMLAVQAFPWSSGESPFSIRAFSMDGRWRSIGNRVGVFAAVDGELRRMGIDVPSSSARPEETGGPAVEILREMPSTGELRPGSLPRAYRRECNIQMKSETGFVDISSGKIPRKTSSFENTLIASGWKFAGPTVVPGEIRVAERTHGRETSIVILDEKEGECLFIRRLEK